MEIGNYHWPFERTASAAPVWRGRLEAERLPVLAEAVREDGGQLIALWGADERQKGQGGKGFSVHCAFLTGDGLAWVSSDLDAAAPAYPDLSAVFPQASRMQRGVFDLLGIVASGAADSRKWLRHGRWPENVFPLRHDFPADKTFATETDAYPFVSVEGEGVHEIPVGPVHAGTIEPGHFRFSIIGDRVLKLEERLGYKHKGMEKRFVGLDLLKGAKLAARVSGDSHTAYSWAYAMAAEMATGAVAPPRAVWVRALLLEMERVANHLGDLGYLGNDVALAFAFNQFWLLKEDWLRLCKDLFGHRYLFDIVVPGGVAGDIAAAGAERLRAETERIEAAVKGLRAIYDEHAGLQDRFNGTGRLTPTTAARLGLTGLAGRASGQAWDARTQFPCAPYGELGVRMATRRGGDVTARSDVRFDEVLESLRLIRDILGRLPAGETRVALAPANPGAEGLGWVEGWRGEVVVALEVGEGGRLARCHPHDPSWQNWPLLEVAILGNIVPDFPLINKSFNLSYCGQDL